MCAFDRCSTRSWNQRSTPGPRPHPRKPPEQPHRPLSSHATCAQSQYATLSCPDTPSDTSPTVHFRSNERFCAMKSCRQNQFYFCLIFILFHFSFSFSFTDFIYLHFHSFNIFIFIYYLTFNFWYFISFISWRPEMLSINGRLINRFIIIIIIIIIIIQAHMLS